MSQLILGTEATTPDSPGSGKISLYYDGTNLKARDASSSYSLPNSVGKFFIPAKDMTARTLLPATYATVQMAATYTDVAVFDFDKDSIEVVYCATMLPYDYKQDTNITGTFYWFHSSAATPPNDVVRWSIRANSFATGDTLNAGSSDSYPVDSTGGTASVLYISSPTSSFAIVKAGSHVSAGDLINFTIVRSATATEDTLAMDARLVGVCINYTRA